MNLKEAIKQYAYEIGADLVGFGDIGRCRHAPIMMSPQGLYPEGKTVIVMGVHHPDACVELGGEEHPQKIGPYSVQYLMNSKLDEMSYRMATFIEEKGWGVVPICSSNIWRYNSYKDLKAVFAPDVSHIYMSVVAGLTDMGYNGLALSPEYGARNRFITVITDAEIEPDPLIPPGTICDHCMLCRKHCPSQALSKEIDGEKVLKIGDYEYRFANKNLWRCAWGEHFDLDLDLELPEKVTEEVIVEAVKQYGVRSGEMGQCLKFCVPAKIRTFDRSYSKSPMRQYGIQWNEETESRAVTDKLINGCYHRGIEHVVVQSAETLKAKGIDIETMLPGAKSAISLIRTHPKDVGNKREGYTSGALRTGIDYHINSVCYDLTRDIEAYGFRTVMTIEASGSHCERMEKSRVNAQIALDLMEGTECDWQMNTVFTRKRFPERALDLSAGFTAENLPTAYRPSGTLTNELKCFAKELGADLAGVSGVDRIEDIAAQLRPQYEGETYLLARDHSIRFKVWDPQIVEEKRHVFTATDYLPEAKSVLVIGLRYHKKVLEFAVKPPAEAVGPYAFQTYITQWQGRLLASQLIQKLNHLGYKAVMTGDLMGIGSAIASPRGYVEDLYGNRFAAVAAGLGTIGKSGRVVTDEFGTRQRFIAIVTDAQLDADAISALQPELCENCDDRCLKACPTTAMSARQVEFSCEGVHFSYNHIDINRCDWSKRYAIAGDSGFKYLGSPLDEIPAGEVTAATLAEALKKHDPVKKYRPVSCEPCMTSCPYSRVQE